MSLKFFDSEHLIEKLAAGVAREKAVDAE